MDVQDLSNEFSDVSDIEDIPRKEKNEDSNAEFVTLTPTIKRQNKPMKGQWIRQNKPMKGQWIVKLEKLTKCQNCNIFLLNSEQTAKHSQKHL